MINVSLSFSSKMFSRVIYKYIFVGDVLHTVLKNIHIYIHIHIHTYIHIYIYIFVCVSPDGKLR